MAEGVQRLCEELGVDPADIVMVRGVVRGGVCVRVECVGVRLEF